MKRCLMCRRLLLVAFSLLPAWPAVAFDMPSRKPGLWQIAMKSEHAGSPSEPIIAQHCIDAATDKEMNAYGSNMSKDMCSKQDTKKVGEKIISDGTCQLGAMSITTHAEYSGSFDSAYTINTTSIITGGPASTNGKSNMVIEAKWMGACKPDQKPGDMIMPVGNQPGGMMKINIRDVMKGPPAGN